MIAGKERTGFYSEYVGVDKKYRRK